VIHTRGSIASALLLAIPPVTMALAQEAEVKETETTTKCLTCHTALKVAPGIAEQWRASKHAAQGVGCEACHQADKADPDAIEHFGDLTISVIPTPNDCRPCHQQETEEFERSRHSKATSYIQATEAQGGRDAFLAYQVEGKTAAVMGCEKCHGTQVRIDGNETSKLHYQDWPNDGIGRINPDGSAGTCSACHTRHVFSVAEARQPETCGTCHMGPDHPQYEIYMESKHGVRYAKEKGSIDWDLPTGEWGGHLRFPVCVTCHMGAINDLEATHDVSSRLSWQLEAKRSERTEGWEEGRKRMATVCRACHSRSWTDNTLRQFDETVEHYNGLYDQYFALYKGLADDGLITFEQFDEPIDYQYFEFWHHEGRRARMGASMMGWDFVQWHGFYELVRGLSEMKELDREIRAEHAEGEE